MQKNRFSLSITELRSSSYLTAHNSVTALKMLLEHLGDSLLELACNNLLEILSEIHDVRGPSRDPMGMEQFKGAQIKPAQGLVPVFNSLQSVSMGEE